MRQRVQLFLFAEAAAFLIAASIHFGLLMTGYEHQKAGIAETVIGVVLLGGLAATLVSPGSTRAAGSGRAGIRPARHVRRDLHDRDRRRAPHGARRRLSHRDRARPHCRSADDCEDCGGDLALLVRS